MFDQYKSQLPDLDPNEASEWVEALEDVVDENGPSRARYLLRQVLKRSRRAQRWRSGVDPDALYQHHRSTKSRSFQAINHGKAYSTDRPLERHGHGSACQQAVSWQVHFIVRFVCCRLRSWLQPFLSRTTGPWWWRPDYDPRSRSTRDLCPCVSRGSTPRGATRFLSDAKQAGVTLPLTHNPWLMPDFWRFPTVSMGLGPISAIYRARFNRYLHNRGIKDTSENRFGHILVTANAMSRKARTLSVAAREGPDNLTFVVAVTSSDSTVRFVATARSFRTRAVFRGAGWHVIKVVVGDQNGILFFAEDIDGALVQRCNEVVDGQFQKYSVEDGAHIRKDFGNGDPENREASLDGLEDRLLS